MHCAVLSQEEDKLRGFALTIIRTLLVPNVSLPDPYRNGTISNSVSDATEKHGKSFRASLGTRTLAPSSRATKMV